MHCLQDLWKPGINVISPFRLTVTDRTIINAIDEMIAAYNDGCEVVYSVRNNCDTDKRFKRITAEGYYKLLNLMGSEIVFNHADYRLLSNRVLRELAEFKEVNLFLRGMIPLVGFKSTSVYYRREERIAGENHYPLKKCLHLPLTELQAFLSNQSG